MKKAIALVVALMVVSSLCAAQELGLKGVGGSLGYVSLSYAGTTSTESLGGLAFAAHADLGEVGHGIGLFPEVQCFSTSKDISGVTVKASDFAINANAHYNIAMDGGMKPYVGAGLGFNSFSTTVDLPVVTAFGFTVGGGSVTASATRIGINLLAGANYAMNDKLTLFAEPRYVLTSDFNHFLIKVGVTYAMK